MAKLVFSLIVCFMLLTVSLQQAAATCDLTDTNNLNRVVLNYLKNKNVKLFNPPTKDVDASICGGLWTQQGTCCDVESVKAFIKSKAEASASRWGKYISRLVRIKAKLLQAFRKIMKVINLSKLKAKVSMTKANEKVDKSFAKVYSMLPENEAQFNAMKAFVDDFEKKIDEFKKKGKTCFDAMKTAKANILCAACSATGATYTSAQSSTEAKFKVTQADCNSLLQKCLPVWNFNFQLATVAQFFNMLLAGRKANAKSSFKSEKEVPEEDMLAIKDDLAQCSIDTDNKFTCLASKLQTVSADAVASRICTKLFSVTQDNSYVEGDETVDSDIDDKDADDSDQTASDLNKDTATVTSRRLQAVSADLNIGVEVASTNTYNAMMVDNSGLIPSASVDTSAAGDSTSGKGSHLMAVACLSLTLLSLAF